ncbi:MAG: molybdopterin molybdenumtransferase MoeA, partial [Verrucomicrobia bacterium]|nr:molybdopterin molybdenumtransferase MoeA [Verrucomicrobiota bacterium]
MLELEEALSRILLAIQPLDAESIPLAEAHGRICAETISAALDLPAFDNSAMDGYAVRANEVTGASATKPVILRQLGRVAAGETFPDEVTAGGCVRVFTGSALPRGSDAVVMQEDTVADTATGQVQICD